MKRYDAVAKSIDDIELKASDKNLISKVEEAEKALNELDGKRSTSEIDADIIDLEIKRRSYSSIR